MITTAAPRRRPYLAIALLLSLLLHLGGVLAWRDWGRALVAPVPQRQQQDEIVATSDVVRIEKRTVPRPAVRRPNPATVAQPQPPTQPRRNPTPQHHQVARVLERQFRNTTAQAPSDVTNVKPPKLPPSAIKHYDLVMQGAIADLETAQGLYDVTQVGRSGDRDWYYLRVYVVWPDGYRETVDIPWPVYFPRDDDPIADGRPFREIPPPADFHLPHPFALSRIVCLYFRKDCQAAITSAQ